MGNRIEVQKLRKNLSLAKYYLFCGDARKKELMHNGTQKYYVISLPINVLHY